MPANGIDLNQPGLWAAAIAMAGAFLKAFQVTRRLDRMDEKMDKLSDDVAFLRGLLKGKK